MFEHVNSTCVDGSGSWLPLIEYSVKTGVSLSTIRRKIKSNSIQYRLEKGRYLILHQEAGQAPTLNIPTPKAVETPPPKVAVQREHESDETVRMVTEAFEHALNEKEERIQALERRNHELEEHLNELRLLVQVLEEKYEVRY